MLLGTLDRRGFLKVAAGISSAAIMAACVPQPTEPAQEAPAKPGDKPAAPVKPVVTLRVGAWESAVRAWMRDAPADYGEMTDGVDIDVEVVPYGESSKKALTGLATGTLQDVLYAPIKWGMYAAFKGVFLFLDELIETKDPGMADFFGGVIEGITFEDKVYALPHELHPGRPTFMFYNKELLAEKGVEEPTDDWTMDDYLEKASKITDKENRIWGADWIPTVYYDFANLARNLGGDVFSDDSKQFLFNVDPKCIEAARWQVDARTKYEAIPNREDREGLQALAGGIGFHAGGPPQIGTYKSGAQFDWDVVLGPTGPGGLRGGYAFTNSMCLYSKTKHPEEAYDLAMYMTSFDVMKAALLEEGHNPARKSIWASPEAAADHSIWKRAHDWLDATIAKQNFPLPYNLRYDELQDRFGNLILDLWYGEVDFGDGMDVVQQECQKIVDLPRE